MRQLLSRETQYIRRRNQDGTVDSICSRCGLTIGRAFHPGILEALEGRHVCQPVERRKRVRIAYRIHDPTKKKQVNLFRKRNGSSGFPSEMTTFNVPVQNDWG